MDSHISTSINSSAKPFLFPPPTLVQITLAYGYEHTSICRRRGEGRPAGCYPFLRSRDGRDTSRFNDEFDFLENIIRPSCIRVLINSEGGSVLYGMSTYSTIANATVDTECIIEGVAASMASIIWAAGKRSLMRDYAILMIHNPMLPDDDGGEPSDMVTAFTKQIETIYRKRFGLKAEHVRAIMDGQAGRTGPISTHRLPSRPASYLRSMSSIPRSSFAVKCMTR